MRTSTGLTAIAGAALLYVGVAGAVSLHAQDAVTPETNLDNALPRDATGADIFRLACSTCHAIDGTGSPQSVVGFQLPLPDGHDFPDFTDCPSNTAEPFRAWNSIVHRGGPIRGMDRHMPQWGDALSDAQIERVVKHLWTLCTDPSWPRGDMNFPRAFFTEKAFPENEAVLTTAVTGTGTKAVTNTITYEHRLKSRSQYEISIPINFQQQDTPEPWGHGFGDMEVALRRVFFANTPHKTIFAAGGAVTLPTGSESEGLGGGVTIWEPFAMFGKGFAGRGFLQMHGGIELPTNKDKAVNESFLRTAVGYTLAQDKGFGRAWTPMGELLIAHPFGEPTEVDVVPQMQISLSKMQHILLSVGARVPVTEREGRHPQFLTYMVWDWFEGGLFEFWK
jgi:mono/diheme cytochrome c family protein